MKNIFEIFKELIPIVLIASIALIGYAIASIFISINFVSDEGEILWKSIFIGVACLGVGYVIYRLAEKLWEK